MKKIKILKSLFIKNRIIIALIIFLTGFYIIPRVPYLNLVIAGYVGPLIWICAIVIFGFKLRSYLILAVALLAFVCVLTLFKNDLLAEDLGNSAFLIILTGVTISIINQIKGKKK